ncbi:MAG: hypothetical protein AB7S50_14555 [Bacteroidales bacterium]
MLIVLGVILIVIAIVFIAYFFKKPIETRKDEKVHKTAGLIGSIGLMLLGILLIFRQK